MKTIYLDNNATTQIAPEVLDAMLPYLTKFYGNPGSSHRFGSHVAKKIAYAREQVAHLIGAHEDEIIFTSCGSEGDNTAIMSALHIKKDKRKIVISKVEHPAIRMLCNYLGNNGYTVTEIPVDTEGRLDMDIYKKSLTNDTAIVSIMWANNETGVIFPVEEAACMAKERGIYFHTDAVQAVGKIPINLKDSSIDMLSLSGHKFHAPKGIGALYVKRGTKYFPFLMGGHQEKGRRAGTENCAGIIGLGMACELADKNMTGNIKGIKELRDRFENRILSDIQGSIINGTKDMRLPNTSNIGFKGIDAGALLSIIDEKYGICASAGAACNAGSTEPSHVLSAMDLPYEIAKGTVRFSFSIYNTEEETDFASEKISETIKKLKQQ